VGTFILTLDFQIWNIWKRVFTFLGKFPQDQHWERCK